MTVFPCREDEEAEDEENGDSRKDACLRRDRRCRARESGNERRTVETSLTRINRSRNITKLIEAQRDSRRDHAGSLLIFRDPEKGATTTVWCGRWNGHASLSASADGPVSFWFCCRVWSSSPSTSFPATSMNTTFYNIRPSSRTTLLKVRILSPCIVVDPSFESWA